MGMDCMSDACAIGKIDWRGMRFVSHSRSLLSLLRDIQIRRRKKSCPFNHITPIFTHDKHPGNHFVVKKKPLNSPVESYHLRLTCTQSSTVG